MDLVPTARRLFPGKEGGPVATSSDLVAPDVVGGDRSGPDAGSRRDVPPALLLVALVVLAVNMVVTVAGGRTASVSGDEPVHVSRMQSWLDHGWYLPKEHMSGGEPDALGMGYVYGPAAALPGHLLAVATGAEDWGTVSTSTAAYDARRVVINLFGFVGLAAAGALAWLLLGSWRWGVLGASLLAAVPMWTGHAMFNIKDVPVAAGYTLLTAGLVAVTVVRRRFALLGAGAAITGGTFVAVGTRPGMWPAIALSAVVLVAGMWWVCVPRRTLRNAILVLGAALVVAYGALVWLYPNVFAAPLTMALESARASSDFPVGAATMVTAGIHHGVRATWFTVPVWFAAQLPVVITLLAAVGLGAGVLSFLRARRTTKHGDRDGAVRLGVALVAMQALALPLAAMAQRAVIYSGVRQLLFVVPAVAVLAAYGLQRAFGWRRLPERRWWRPAVGTVAALGLVVPTVAQVRLFPYGYMFFNAATATRPVNGNWATDYWRTSAGELAAATGSFDPVREHVVTGGQWDAEPIPGGCRPGGLVTRPLFAQDVLMQWAAICPIPTYPTGGIDFRLGGNGGAFRHGPWSPPGPAGMTTQTWATGLQLVLPDELRGRALDLHLTGQQDPATPVPDLIEVTVNGNLVGAFQPSREPERMTFRVSAAKAGDTGTLTITLAATRKENRLGFVLRSLTLDAAAPSR